MGLSKIMLNLQPLLMAGMLLSSLVGSKNIPMSPMQ